MAIEHAQNTHMPTFTNILAIDWLCVFETHTHTHTIVLHQTRHCDKFNATFINTHATTTALANV